MFRWCIAVLALAALVWFFANPLGQVATTTVSTVKRSISDPTPMPTLASMHGRAAPLLDSQVAFTPMPATPTPRGDIVVRQRQSVLVASQNRNEWVTYKTQRFVDREGEREPWMLFLDGERVQWHVFGTVAAGINMRQIKMSDIVQTDELSITVTLPAPELLSFTPLFDGEQGTQISRHDLTMFSDVDRILSSTVFEQAVAQIYTDACEDGILTSANSNAQQLMRENLLAMGFEHVTIHITKPGSCKPPTSTS